MCLFCPTLYFIADHYPIVIKPSAPKRRHPPTTIRSRPWHRVDWNTHSLEILNADWDSFMPLLMSTPRCIISYVCGLWNSVTGVTVHCPVVSRTVRRPDCPWLRDSAVRKVMEERDAARRVLAVSRSVADRQTYRKLRNQAKQLLTRARRTHLTELLRGDQKRFWARTPL